MPRLLALGFLGLVCALTLSALAAPPDKDDKDKKADPPKFTGRPGELSEEEEAKIDKLVERFIRFDIGLNPKDKEALTELNKLGPEAIPSLIRGINKSAQEGYSCPVTVIGNKLGRLIETSDDPRVLQFIRDELGAGITKKTAYETALGNLKLKAVYRKRKVEEIAKATSTSPSIKTSPGQKNPGEEKPK